MFLQSLVNGLSDDNCGEAYAVAWRWSLRHKRWCLHVASTIPPEPSIESIDTTHSAIQPSWKSLYIRFLSCNKKPPSNQNCNKFRNREICIRLYKWDIPWRHWNKNNRSTVIVWPIQAGIVQRHRGFSDPSLHLSTLVSQILLPLTLCTAQIHQSWQPPPPTQRVSAKRDDQDLKKLGIGAGLSG